jgi:hypothetical protein
MENTVIPRKEWLNMARQIDQGALYCQSQRNNADAQVIWTTRLVAWAKAVRVVFTKENKVPIFISE